MAPSTVADIIIDPEFQALIPPLSDEERWQLESNILKDGCRDALVVWTPVPVDGEHKCYDEDSEHYADGTRCKLQAGDGVWTCETCGYNPLLIEQILLDGHNRFEICERLNIDYRTVEQECADRDDAKIWIIRNQFGRRNLQPFQRIELAEHLEPLVAAKARANQGTRTDLSVNLPKGRSIDTRAEVASAAGVSPRTYDKGKVISERATEPVKQALRRGEVSIDKAYRDIVQPEKRQQKIDAIVSEAGASDLPDGQRFPVIYADPPWRYEHVKTESRAIENQYPTMALDEICALPIGDLAAEHAVLFMWATSPKLAESMRVIEAWGFTYRTCMVWVKDQIGMGYYARQQHEMLLIASRGELPVPEPANRPSSVVNAPRQEHSAKPEVFYELIDQMYPAIPRIELFSRTVRDGWERWGNQAAVA